MTLEAIKSPETAPTADIDHLINHLAVIVRATKNEYNLTEAQKKICFDRAMKIIETFKDQGMGKRILEAAELKDPFWVPHSDTTLKYLNEAGILVDTLGV